MSAIHSLIGAAAALLGLGPKPLAYESADRQPRSRWTKHTKAPYNGAKAKARRKTAHKSRRQNRAA